MLELSRLTGEERRDWTDRQLDRAGTGAGSSYIRGITIHHQSTSLSVVPGSVCECGVSQLYGPDRERERGVLARSLKAEWSRQQ